MRLWILLKASGDYWLFCFSKESTQLVSDYKFCLAFCAYWFQCQFILQSFCYASLGIFHTCSALVRYPFLHVSPHVISPIPSGCQRHLSQLVSQKYGVLSEFQLPVLCKWAHPHDEEARKDRKKKIMWLFPHSSPNSRPFSQWSVSSQGFKCPQYCCCILVKLSHN